MKCDFWDLTFSDSLSDLSYTLNVQIETNKEGIWKFEFDQSVVEGIILTKSGMTFDNFECVDWICTSATPVEEGKWTVQLELFIDTFPVITSLQVDGEEDYNCEGENCK